METTKNPYLRTQIAIIKALLDGSKKTQNQIARETEYKKSTISHALDYLEKRKVIIREQIKKESGYTSKGKYKNKLCWLTYEVDNGRHILEFLRETDTSLISDLQKSDKIMSMLVKKWEMNLTYKASNLVENPVVKNGIKWIPDDILHSVKEDFKKKLKISPLFFELCLREDHIPKGSELQLLTFDKLTNQPPLTQPDELYGQMLDRLFVACIIIEGYKKTITNEAIEYVVNDKLTFL